MDSVAVGWRLCRLVGGGGGSKVVLRRRKVRYLQFLYRNRYWVNCTLLYRLEFSIWYIVDTKRIGNDVYINVCVLPLESYWT